MRFLLSTILLLLLSACSSSEPSQSTKQTILSVKVGTEIKRVFELYSRGNTDEALKGLIELNKRKKDFSDFDKAYIERMTGNVYASTSEQPTKAITFLKSAISRNALPESDQLSMIKLVGDLALSNQEFNTAISYYERHLKESPVKNQQVLERKAYAHFELSQYQEAVNLSRAAMNMGSDVKQVPMIQVIHAQLQQNNLYIAFANAKLLSSEILEDPQLTSQLVAIETSDANNETKKTKVLQLLSPLISKSSRTNQTEQAIHSPNKNIRVPPNYPTRAAKQGIEGWVRLQFDITRTGHVKNVQVIESTPAGIFDEEASKALQQWRYIPKEVDGEPVEQTGLTVQLDFRLQR